MKVRTRIEKNSKFMSTNILVVLLNLRSTFNIYYFTLTKFLWITCCHPHFTDEKIEAQRDKGTCLK